MRVDILNKSLDDIIREKQISGRPKYGPVRRGPPEPYRSEPYSRPPRAAPPPRRIPDPQPTGYSVRVQGASPDWTAQDLKEIFTEQGLRPSAIWSERDRNSRVRKWYLEYPTRNRAQECITEMDGAEVDGLPIRLTLVPPPSTQETHEPREPREPRAPNSTGNGIHVRAEGLDPNWDAKTIRDIFEQEGFEVEVEIMWDRSGRSQGKCDIIVPTMSEARQLVRKMDRALVEDFELSLFIPPRGPSGPPPSAPPPAAKTGPAFPQSAPSNQMALVPSQPRGGRGGRRRYDDRPTKTREELDKELLAYSKGLLQN